MMLDETDTTVADFKASFPFGGVTVNVVGILDSTKSPNDPYVLCEATHDDRVIVVINMRHPQVSSIDENGLLDYFRFCTYDALAEWRARRQGTIEPSTIRKLKDWFLRVRFDVEMG